MTVRLTPRDNPERTLVLGGVSRVYTPDSVVLYLVNTSMEYTTRWFKLKDIAAIELDDAPGDFW